MNSILDDMRAYFAERAKHATGQLPDFHNPPPPNALDILRAHRHKDVREWVITAIESGKQIAPGWGAVCKAYVAEREERIKNQLSKKG